MDEKCTQLGLLVKSNIMVKIQLLIVESYNHDFLDG
jgi:hypothetical protein